jgi:glutamyl-Q tRNA(Asp) synthetase
MIVTRFAPSPTGRLHAGHAFSALFAARAAEGGRFLLRIEDIDGTRCRPEFEAGIYEDLAWLGLVWETPVRRQSAHFADYRAALDRLAGMQLLYPCFCTRRTIAAEVAASAAAPHGPDGPLYPGTCRGRSAAERAERVAAGESFALRLDMAGAITMTGTLTLVEGSTRVAAAPAVFGDVVLARKETPASYHLAVTVDDALQGVTLVTRGEDLFPASYVHRVLQTLLDLPEPAYRHHRLLTGPDGRRLAKREGAPALADVRARGVSAADFIAALGLDGEP